MIDRETYRRLYAEVVFILKDLTLVGAFAYGDVKTHSFFLNRLLLMFMILTMFSAVVRLMALFPDATWPRGLARLSPALAPVDKVVTFVFAVASVLAIALAPAVLAARAANVGW